MPFNPGSISGLQEWLKSDVQVFSDNAFTTPAVNAGPAKSWTDQSGAGNSPILLSGSPTYYTNIMNGLPAILFNPGASDALSKASATLTNNTAWSFFAAVMSGSDFANRCFATVGSATAGIVYRFGNAGLQVAKPGTLLGQNTRTLQKNTPYIVSAIYDGTTIQFYLNGVWDGHAEPGAIAFTLNAVYIGSVNAAQFFNNYIGEVLWYNTNLTPTQQGQVNGYLIQRYLYSSVPAIIDISKYPYLASPANADNTTAFQLAWDAIQSDGNPNNPHTMYVPGGQPYVISRPILADAQFAAIRGDGQFSTNIQQINACDGLQIGIYRRSPTSTVPTLDWTYWPDITTTMDGSAGYELYGIRTKGVAYGYFFGTPFDRGPSGFANWGTTTKFVVDFAFVANMTGGWNWSVNNGNAPIRLFGVGSPSSTYVTPYACTMAGTTFHFFFTTDDGTFREASFPLPGSPAVLQRCSVQIDLTVPSVSVWLNGINQTVDLTNIGTNWVAGLHLLSNEYQQFQLGTAIFGGTLIGNISDLTCCGFKITCGALLYTSASTQTRIDSATINDLNRFYTLEPVGSPGTVFGALLPLAESGNSLRQIQWTGNTYADMLNTALNAAIFGYGLFLGDGSLTPTDTPYGFTIMDIQLSSNVVNVGRTLAIGTQYSITMERSTFSGGMWNVGGSGPGVGSTYPISVKDCTFESGTENVFINQAGFWWGFNNQYKFWGPMSIRTLLSFFDETKAIWAPGGRGGSHTNDFVIKAHHSIGLTLKNIAFDFEGGGPTTIWVEAGANVGAIEVTLEDVTFGSVAGTLPRIILVGPSFFDPSTFGEQKLILDRIHGLFQTQNIMLQGSYASDFGLGAWNIIKR